MKHPQPLSATSRAKTQNEVADKMVADLEETDSREVPQFLLLLGDVIYNFDEGQYYYDQDYGYLRLIVTGQQLRIEYHPASDAANPKAPDDSVTIDLTNDNQGAMLSTSFIQTESSPVKFRIGA